MFIIVPSWEGRLEPRRRILVVWIVLETCLLLNLVILIVAGIYHDRRVVMQSSDVLYSLLANRFDKFWPHRIVSAAKHEVLPHQNAHVIAAVIESIVFVDATSPNSDTNCVSDLCQEKGVIDFASPRHYLIAFNHKLQPVSVLGSGDSREKVIGRNPA